MSENSEKSHNPVPPVKLPRPVSPLLQGRYLIIGGICLLVIVVIMGAKFLLPDRYNSNHIIFNFGRSTDTFRPVAAQGQPDGKISIVRDAPGLNGKGCLQFEYYNEVDRFVGVGTLEPNLNNFKQIKIRMCSKEERIFVVSVDEETGPVYLYVFELRPGEWTDVTAAPDKFIPSSHGPDPNGKLDVDRLTRRLTIADLSGDRGIIGPNKFWIEKIEIIR